MLKNLSLSGLLIIMSMSLAYAVGPEPSLDQEDRKEATLIRCREYCDEFIDFKEKHQKDYLALVTEAANTGRRIRLASLRGMEPGSSASKNRVQPLTNDRFAALLNSFDQSIEESLTVAKSERENLDVCLNENGDLEKLLSGLLEKRFEFLKRKATLLEPGVPFQCLTVEEHWSKRDPIEQHLTRGYIDTYQFINRLILSIARLQDLRSLREETKLKIKCSRALWDNFAGVREDLGHPDETFVGDPGEEAHYPIDQINPATGLIMRDLSYYNDYIRTHEIHVPVRDEKGRRIIKDHLLAIYTTVLMTDYEHSKIYPDQKGVLPPPPYPDWLKSPEELASEASSSGETGPLETPLLEETQKKKPSQKKGKKKGRHAARKPKKPEVKVTSPAGSTTDGATGEEDVPAEEPTEEGTLSATPEIGSSSGLSSSSESEQLTGHSDVPEDLPSEVRGSVAKLMVGNEPDEPKTEESASDSAAPTSEDTPEAEVSSSIDAPLRPRGLRARSSEQSSESAAPELEPLTGKPAKTLDQLFDFQRFQNVCFREIRSLWEHVGGIVNESTGSSHKKLIAPNGDVFGTFAHGDGMTYTDRTIKYIRDAFRQIGYGEDYLATLP